MLYSGDVTISFSIDKDKYPAIRDEYFYRVDAVTKQDKKIAEQTYWDNILKRAALSILEHEAVDDVRITGMNFLGYFASE